MYITHGPCHFIVISLTLVSKWVFATNQCCDILPRLYRCKWCDGNYWGGGLFVFTDGFVVTFVCGTHCYSVVIPYPYCWHSYNSSRIVIAVSRVFVNENVRIKLWQCEYTRRDPDSLYFKVHSKTKSRIYMTTRLHDIRLFRNLS